MGSAEPRVVLVTGAGSGIGRHVARRLLEAGHKLVLVGRREDALIETAEMAAVPPDRYAISPGDVCDPEAATGAVARAVAAFGRLDVLFNNAGAFDVAPFDEITVDNWKRMVDVNLNGAFYFAQAAFRQMKAQAPQGGRIVNNGSVSAHVPRPHAAAYTATKHAITGLTKQICLDGRAFNIAGSQIDIGNVASDMTSAIGKGILQADGSVRAEPVMAMENVVKAVTFMVELPAEANVPSMTLMATAMPFIGRG